MHLPVSQGHGTGAPASSQGTTRQLANGMKELVIWVGLPVRRFAAACDDDTSPGEVPAGNLRQRGSEVHMQRNSAEDPVGEIHEAYEVAQGRTLPEVCNIPERRMIMSFLTNLNKMNPTCQTIHDLLIAAAAPPFDGIIVFSPCGDNPPWSVRRGVGQKRYRA